MLRMEHLFVMREGINESNLSPVGHWTVVVVLDGGKLKEVFPPALMIGLK